MMIPVFSKIVRNVSTAAILAVFLGLAGMASAQNKKQAPPPPPPPPRSAAPAPRPAAPPPSRPVGNSGGGGMYRPNNNGPSVSRPANNGPSVNNPGGNGPSANHPYGGPSVNNPGGGASGVNRQFNSGSPGNHPENNGPSGNRQGNFEQRPGGFNQGHVDQRPGGSFGNNSHPSNFRTSAPRGFNERSTPHGSDVRIRPNGRLSDVHDPHRGIDVHHGLNGNRAISLERGDHSRVFAERGRPGFVQHPYGFHGHEFAQRTYFYHGRAYTHFYHGYAYHGVYMNVYAPGLYYRPGFYGWAYNSWGAPVAYGWGWGGAAWYGYYGSYFQPYPMYPSAAYWLTDYMISSDLQTAYAAHQEAGEVDGAPSSAGGPPELTPDVKQQIADEVRSQLALENQEATQNAQQQDVDPASSGIARMVSDGRPHVFVVGSALDVVDNSQTECALSDGDVITLRTPPPADATVADVVVLSSKGGQECTKQATVSVALADLQEMQNHMRETIDQGLQDLQAKQGTGGLPSLPPSAKSEPAPALYASAAPPPDSNVSQEIQQQAQQADQAETEAAQDTGAPIGAAAAPPPPVPPAAAAPASVELGQTTDQVQSSLGTPARVAKLGPKTIYYYNGMKVTFNNGKVSDVQ